MLSVSFEEYTGEFTTKVPLPLSRVLRRNQIDLVNYQQHLLSLCEYLLLKFLASASLGVPRVQYLYNHIRCLYDLLELLRVRLLALIHCTRVRIYYRLGLPDLLLSQPVRLLLLLVSFNLGLDLYCVVLQRPLRHLSICLRHRLQLLPPLLIYVLLPLDRVQQLLLVWEYVWHPHVVLFVLQWCDTHCLELLGFLLDLLLRVLDLLADRVLVL